MFLLPFPLAAFHNLYYDRLSVLPVQQLAGIFALSLSGLEWVYYLVRIIVTVAVFAFLSRYLCQTTALLLAKSDRELYILGAMPFVYYVFDYSTTKFSMLLYSGNKVVVEFLAFAMCISYVIFLFVYFSGI